jgi:hypothetical protein
LALVSAGSVIRSPPRALRLPLQPTPRPFDQICFLFTMSDIRAHGSHMYEGARPSYKKPDRQPPKLRFSGSPFGFKLILLHRIAPDPLIQERFSRKDSLRRIYFEGLTLGSFNRTGGARRDRTDDLMLAKHALSQLSYGPASRQRFRRRQRQSMVGLGGLEPPTSRLSSARSNQLSYKPKIERTGSENRRQRPRP